MIELPEHAIDQMDERGVSEKGVQLVVERGTPADARAPRIAQEIVFREGYQRRARHYPHKRVKAIFAHRGGEIVIATVIAYYGTWEAN